MNVHAHPWHRAHQQTETPFHKVVTASLIGTTIEWYDFFAKRDI